MTSNRFPKHVRLLRSSDFERIFAARSSVANPWLVLYGAANDVGHPRLGLIVSRRIGGAAERNRWKRLVREAFRLTQSQIAALDLVCVARAPTPPPLRELMEALPSLASRIDRRIEAAAKRSAGDSP